MKHILWVVLTTISLSAFSQHIKIDKKKLEFLKNETHVLVKFKYDNLSFNADNLSEIVFIDYFEEKMASRQKDSTGWTHAYFKHKDSLWQEAYVSKLNETLERYQAPIFSLDESLSTNYYMLVEVSWIYAGYDIGIAKSPSKVKLKLHIFEQDTKKKMTTIPVGITTADNDKEDNDSEWTYLRRIQNAFTISGFKLGIALKRVFDKK
ncbi:hypothetical protein C1T31_07625 [Hanstruepera neustonica]|uniref:Uncharacterized protein n=1 Tax=Hanstruepera neustonica TaxID=1445657 RepID=A0A2K1DZB8_9FLAO|nr:hypothetical protein [Hanstruepera neustonica]PNQ73377.1 hypothetical protein C1T31_07625 [Hanstruepera neustonica]